MSTVDASGAIHGSDGRFAGHIAGESCAELTVPTVSAYDDAPQHITDADAFAAANTAARGKTWALKDDVDATAYDYHRSVGKALFPSATAMQLDMEDLGCPWKVTYIDDSGSAVTMPGGSAQHLATNPFNDTDDDFADDADREAASLISVDEFDDAKFSDYSAWMEDHSTVTETGRDIEGDRFVSQRTIRFDAVDPTRSPATSSGLPDYDAADQHIQDALDTIALDGDYDDFGNVRDLDDQQFAEQVERVADDVDGNFPPEYGDTRLSITVSRYNDFVSVGTHTYGPDGLSTVRTGSYLTRSLTVDPEATGSDQARAIATKLHGLYRKARQGA